MSYAVKYRISYKRRGNYTTTIDILEKGYGGSITNLTAGAEPLRILSSGNVNNIYEPTRGSSAEIDVVVQPLLLIGDLFTSDPQKYIIKIYNGDSGTNLFWQGFVSTGVYTEGYSSSKLTQVTIYCNDGMTLLDDMAYKVAEDGIGYTGFSTVASVMNEILSKINISFTSVISNNNLEIDISTLNPFLDLTVNNQNYYDENGTAMSCRKVINSIFQPLGLVMTFRGNNIFLIDPLNLSNPANGVIYDIPNYVATDSSIGGYLDISNKEISFYSTTENSLDVVQPNKISVEYDPYNTAVAKYDFSDPNNYYVNPNTWTRIQLRDSNGDFSCYWNTDVSMVGWTKTPNAKFMGVQYTGNPPEYFLIQPRSSCTSLVSYDASSSEKFVYAFNYNVNQDENTNLLLSFDAYVNTVDPSNPFHADSDTKHHNGTTYVNYPAKTEVQRFWSYNFIRMSGYNYNLVTDPLYGAAHWFTSTTNPCSFHIINSEVAWQDSIVNDTWTNISLMIDLGANEDRNRITGDVSICFYSTFYTDSDVPINSRLGIKNILYKNFTLKSVDNRNEDLQNNGIKTTSSLLNNTAVNKSPLNINLTNGIGPYGTSRGAFSSQLTNPVGVNIAGFSRNDSSIYDAAVLLMQSLSTQYSIPRYKLNANLDVQNQLLGIEQKLIKDTSYLGSKAFHIVNSTYYDKHSNIFAEMVECASTRDSIS